jgi:hypothetical protein
MCELIYDARSDGVVGHGELADTAPLYLVLPRHTHTAQSWFTSRHDGVCKRTSGRCVWPYELVLRHRARRRIAVDHNRRGQRVGRQARREA